MLHFVYILKCEGNKLYTGYTTDLYRRFKEHAFGTGAKFTRAFKPEAMIYADIFLTKSNAMKEEARIKKLTRKQKDEMIERSAFNLVKLPNALKHITNCNDDAFTRSGLVKYCVGTFLRFR